MTRARIAVLLAASIATATATPGAAQPPADAMLVMPFDNAGGDPTLFWLSEGSAVLLAELLERYGAAAIRREERLSAFDRLQLPPAAALSHATMIKIGQFVGAGQVVVGTYEIAENRLTVRARAIELHAARMTDEAVEQGALEEIFDVYDRVARRLRGATAAAAPPPPGSVSTSPAAFELYVKGLIAESFGNRRGYLEQALKAAPADDRIRLALWQVHTDAAEHQRALAAVSAVPSTSPHSRTARYHAARSQIELGRYDAAFETLTALQRESPSAAVLNALGVVQVRRRQAASRAPAPAVPPATPPDAGASGGRAVYFFNQAAQTDPADPDYCFNLGYAYLLDRDPPAAVYWLREAVRRDPADGDAHRVLAAALQQTGAAIEAARERELAARLSESDAPPASAPADAVPRGLERLKEQLGRGASRVDEALASVGQRNADELAAFHLDRGRRAYEREVDREAEEQLRRALYLSPYLAEAHRLLGRVYLRGGRIADAIQAFTIALWSEETVAGHIELAKAYLAAQNQEGAREALDRALALDPDSAEAKALRAKIGG